LNTTQKSATCVLKSRLGPTCHSLKGVFFYLHLQPSRNSTGAAMAALGEEGARLELEGNSGSGPGVAERARRGAEGRRMAWRRREREVGCHLWRRSSRAWLPRFSIATIRRTCGRCYSSDFGRHFLAFSVWIRILVTVAKFLPA
jgi:hypothetical protein